MNEVKEKKLKALKMMKEEMKKVKGGAKEQFDRGHKGGPIGTIGG